MELLLVRDPATLGHLGRPARLGARRDERHAAALVSRSGSGDGAPTVPRAVDELMETVPVELRWQ